MIISLQSFKNYWTKTFPVTLLQLQLPYRYKIYFVSSFRNFYFWTDKTTRLTGEDAVANILHYKIYKRRGNFLLITLCILYNLNIEVKAEPQINKYNSTIQVRVDLQDKETNRWFLTSCYCLKHSLALIPSPHDPPAVTKELHQKYFHERRSSPTLGRRIASIISRKASAHPAVAYTRRLAAFLQMLGGMFVRRLNRRFLVDRICYGTDLFTA